MENSTTEAMENMTDSNEMVNRTLVEELDSILMVFDSNRKAMINILVNSYADLVGNIMVMIAVTWRKEMRNARNIFIFNLSLSDLLLSFTIPFTAFDALTSSWLFGYTPIPCRLVKTVPCIAVFMSSLTIVTIAIDRYRIIVHSSGRQVGELVAWLLLPVIMILATLLSSPLLYSTKLQTLKEIFNANSPLPDEYAEKFSKILVCYEDWTTGNGTAPTKHDRIWFTIYSSSVQFLLPLAVITVIYIKIYHFLKTKRFPSRNHEKRQRRTNLILFSISMIFSVSWLPFSVFCVASELFDLFDSSDNMMLTYCICHLVGMSSAFTNPILYGFLNDNFVKEFGVIFPCLKGWLARREAAKNQRRLEKRNRQRQLKLEEASRPLVASAKPVIEAEEKPTIVESENSRCLLDTMVGKLARKRSESKRNMAEEEEINVHDDHSQQENNKKNGYSKIPADPQGDVTDDLHCSQPSPQSRESHVVCSLHRIETGGEVLSVGPAQVTVAKYKDITITSI